MRAVRLILSVVVLLSWAQSGVARTPWMEDPERITLGTGLDCLYHWDDTSSTTIVQIFVPGGRGAVPQGRDGLAYLATHMSLEIPDEGKARDLMAQATRMRLSVWEDCSIIHIECLSDNLEAALRVASVIVQDPLLTGIRIDRAKAMMSLRGRAERDDAVATARNAVLRAFYGDRGYGTNTYGTEDSLRAIDRKEVLSFHRRHFTRAGVFFSVGTDLDKETVRALLEKHFAKFPAGEPIASPPALPSLPDPKDREVVLIKDSRQTYLGRAFVLPAPGPEVYAKALLLEIILGRGPGSRLWDLRSAGKLAYHVDARTVWTRSSGILETYLETENIKSAGASAALEDILAILYDQGIGEDEFESAKIMAGAHFLRSIETKPARTMIIGLFEVLGLGHGYVSGLFEAIKAVTLTEMNAFIRDALGPSKALRVSIGPGDPDGPGME